MAHKMLNGIRVELTGAELAEHEEAQRVGHAEAEAKRAQKEINKTKLASGKAKLKELGLDDDELQQILGI